MARRYVRKESSGEKDKLAGKEGKAKVFSCQIRRDYFFSGDLRAKGE